MRQEVRQRHLTAGPGRHRAGLAVAHLDVGRHVSQPYKLQLPAGKEEHILRLELTDEGFLHVTQNGSTHKTHRDRRSRRDRSDVEPMQSGNRLFADAITARLLVPFQFSVAGIGRQAFAALFQKQQAPVPVLLRQIAVSGALSNRLQCVIGIKSRPAGEAGEVLQQHIQRSMRWLALFHQPFVEAAPHGTQFQQFEGIGGHEQHL